MIFTVAIDGPAASGKGTISRAIAKRFGFAHLDTGLLYRAVGARVAEGQDAVEAARALTPGDMERGDLRTLEVAQVASRVAVIPEVRAALVEFQRGFARAEGGAVLDGRDIGTVICPEAEAKLYVLATDETRARRRWLELGGSESGMTEAEVLSDLRARDARDQGRATAPLKPAPDALLLDTTEMSVEDAVQAAIAHVEAAME